MRTLVLISFLALAHPALAQSLSTRFEQSKGTQTPTYPEIISWWKKLDALSSQVRMEAVGPTDAGHPLHLILVTSGKGASLKTLNPKKQNVILINNGIHPGEPDGIDASMLLVRDIVARRYKLPDNVVLAIIPVYNIGGALNRSADYRVDQNGPDSFGFRGNSQNYDLNRDFIKCDTREALTFTRIFRLLDPDIFIDNHVSNGADYRHIMTLISSQHNKVGGKMGTYLNGRFEPALYTSMKQKGFDLVPYVNHSQETPDKGWVQFWDGPRYSSGYATLWHTFAFVPETHMLKPYDQRVASTRAMMESFIEYTGKHGGELKRIREETKKEVSTKAEFPVKWVLDRSTFKSIPFLGYTPAMKPSEVSGLPRLYYDRSKPLDITVPFYDTYQPVLTIKKPKAYIIPQGWWKVTERLQANGIRMRQIGKDTSVKVTAYYIDAYQASPRPYEGHHPNSQVKVRKLETELIFRKGDFYIPMDGEGNRFLMETLEPEGEDSYFAWNFFDPVLGQKEGFSDYVFEETAATYLKANPELRAKLEERKREDTAFARNGEAQLNFVFRNSPYYEPAHMRYPVYRVE